MVAAVTPCLPVSCWLLRVISAVWLFVALPLAAATAAQYEKMVESGLGGLDKSGIAELTFPGRHLHS